MRRQREKGGRNHPVIGNRAWRHIWVQHRPVVRELIDPRGVGPYVRPG
jgi:hypothetical protein